MTIINLCVEPIDPLFFRDSSPFDAGESVYLRCLFPPTPSSAYGLARGVVLESLCKNMNHYIHSGCNGCPESGRCDASGIVGEPSSRNGTLQTRGPYVYRDEMCWYSMPIDIVSDSGRKNLGSGTVSDRPVLTDLGMVRLPYAGLCKLYFNKSETHLISERSMSVYLAGHSLNERDILPITTEDIQSTEQNTRQSGFVVYEPRTGIALDPLSRTTKEAHLYNIQLVRMLNGTSLLITMDGLNGHETSLLKTLCLPFGGENRVVKVSLVEHSPGLVPVSEDQIRQTGRFKLVLLSHADFNGSWLPPGLSPEHDEGVTTWRGELNGIRVRLISAMTGKSIAAGGWDITGRGPRPLRSLVPAGSVYYFESLDTEQSVVKTFHDRCIGCNTQLGLGHVAVGVW